MNKTCTETIDRELTEAELGLVVGGMIVVRKAGESQRDFLSYPDLPTTTNSIRCTGGQFGP
jgi:hypothetical protein